MADLQNTNAKTEFCNIMIIAKKLKNQQTNFYFIISFSFLWVYYALLFPTFSYEAEVFSEQGSDFLDHAYNSNFFKSLWILHGGYLVWMLRIISSLVAKIVTPYYFIYVTGYICLGFIAYFMSFLNHRGLRGVLNDKERFIICLILGVFIAPEYSNFGFVNLTYHGFFFNFLLLFINKNTLNKFEYYTYAFLFAILCISKFHFFAFLPIIIIAIWFHLNHKDKKSAYFYIPAVIMILIQVLSLLTKAIKTAPLVAQKTALKNGLLATIQESMMGLYWWIKGYSINFKILNMPFIANVAAIFIIIYMVTYFIIKHRLQKKPLSQVTLFILIANLLAIGYMSISSVGPPLFRENHSVDFSVLNFKFHRSYFIAYYLIWISLIVFILRCFKGKLLKYIILFLFISCSLHVTFGKQKDRHKGKNINRSASDWKNYYTLLKRENYCIPTNPLLYGGFIRKNCELTKIIEKTSYDDIDVSDMHQKEIRIIGLLLNVYEKEEDLKLLAYDSEGKKVSEAKMLSNKNRHYKYFVFEDTIKANKLVVYKKNDEIVTDNGGVFIFGIKG